MKKKHWLRIAKKNGIKADCFYQRVRMGWSCERAATEAMRTWRKYNAEDEFALYKGEALLSVGTLDEIAQERGVKVETLRFYLSPSHKKRVEASKYNNFAQLIPLDDEEVM